MNRAAARLPFGQHDFQAAVGHCLAQNKLWQDSDADPGSQRRQHRVAIVNPERSEWTYRSCFSCRVAEVPGLARRRDVGDASVLRKTERVRRATVFGKITRRGDEMARDWREDPRQQRGIGEGGDADRCVISFPNQIDVVIAEMKVDGYVRILREKLRQDWRNMEHTKGYWRSKAHATSGHR